ncbi:hypothetical protein [Streptomyces sp. HPF1205]|uniref:hypothetical protein n=1 Tax=Streptomyces sp. HPF1205 TaxID=2873262 RepID=UPI001CED46C2|nr:hypothetical protein [Streptomyces sp. HPF1205]
MALRPPPTVDPFPAYPRNASKEFVIITKRKGLAAAGVVALIAAGSAACGTAQATPQAKVQKAVTKLGEQKSATVGLSFDATPDQIYAAFTSGDSNSGFTRDDAKMVASLHVSMSASTQKQFSLLKSRSGASGGRFAFALSNDPDGKSNLIEMRGLDNKLYLRADVKGLEKLDTSPNAASDLREFNQFLGNAQQLPSSLHAVKAALNGQWVVLDPKAWTDFAKSMAQKNGASGFGSGDSSGSPLGGALNGQMPKIDGGRLLAVLKQDILNNKDATYKDVGKKDGASVVRVTVPARKLAKDLATDLTPILKQIPNISQSDLNNFNDTSGVPNRTIAFDVSVKSGHVSAVTFDLEQLDDQANGKKLPVTLTIDNSADSLDVPAGADQLNPQDIIGMIMQNMPNGPSDASYSGLN